MPELLFEIGTEEIPARFVGPGLASLERLATEGLKNAGLKHGEMRTFGTPRRLALVVAGLDASQPDRQEEALGPPMKAAFDKEGKPTKAALGFAKSQGVTVGELKEIATDKGPRLGLVRTIEGRATAEVLAELLPRLVEKLPFAKTMRWGQSNGFRFVRPIHWFLALFDGQVIPFELANIKSNNQTRGHRFMAPEAFAVSSAAEYLEKLQAAQVMADRVQRRAATQEEVAQAAGSVDAQLVPDEELLNEVTDLVELPVACAGSFDPEFLKVPRPVIISAMREHQRYFALEDKAGQLLPAFIAVNNTRPKDLAVVASGHERVLRARLSDARFFLEEDTKRPLMDFLEDLKPVTYHAKLGSSFEKVARFSGLAVRIADKLGQDSAQVERAALLAKCDLVTEMVGEFPSLQGVVGKEYALLSNEAPEVALAVEEHYLPAGPDSAMPSAMIGVCVGLADRLDTICGLFGIGQKPSGAADPFGLRRAAIGVIRLITENDLKLPLGPVLDVALGGLQPWLHAPFEEKDVQHQIRPLEETKLDVFWFILDRLQVILGNKGVSTDVATAVIEVSRDNSTKAFLNPETIVLPAGMDDLVQIQNKALALAQVKETPDFKPLAIGLKRVMNILRKEADQVPAEAPDPGLFTMDAEKALHDAFMELDANARSRFGQGDFAGFLQDVAALKGPVDKFFDDVLVMDKDEQVRRNRLALLNQIAGLFKQYAEFTHLQLA